MEKFTVMHEILLSRMKPKIIGQLSWIARFERVASSKWAPADTLPKTTVEAQYY